METKPAGLAGPVALALLAVSAALAGCAAGPAPAALELRALRRTASGPGYRYTVEYPVFPSRPEVSREAEGFAEGAIARFLSEGRANRAAWEATASPEELAAGRPPFELIVSWRAERLGPTGISLLLEAYAFVGGAHGSLELKSINYDPAGRRFLGLEEVLGGPGSLEEASAAARAALSERLNPRGDADLARWIEEGTAPAPENYAVFVFGEGGATAIFPPYRVGPWAVGVQRVDLPRRAER